jgi:hypothetical protein
MKFLQPKHQYKYEITFLEIRTSPQLLMCLFYWLDYTIVHDIFSSFTITRLLFCVQLTFFLGHFEGP